MAQSVLRYPRRQVAQNHRTWGKDLASILVGIQQAKQQQGQQQFLRQLSQAVQSGDPDAMNQAITSPNQGPSSMLGRIGDSLNPFSPSRGFSPTQANYLGQLAKAPIQNQQMQARIPIEAERAGAIEKARYDADPTAQERAKYWNEGGRRSSTATTEREQTNKAVKPFETQMGNYIKQWNRMTDKDGKALPGMEYKVANIDGMIDKLERKIGDITKTNPPDPAVYQKEAWYKNLSPEDQEHADWLLAPAPGEVGRSYDDVKTFYSNPPAQEGTQNQSGQITKVNGLLAQGADPADTRDVVNAMGGTGAAKKHKTPPFAKKLRAGPKGLMVDRKDTGWEPAGDGDVSLILEGWMPYLEGQELEEAKLVLGSKDIPSMRQALAELMK